MICPKCKSEMKLIPAGISKKTGKPYQAFYACPDKNCGATINPDKPIQKFEQTLDQQKQDEKWTEIATGKVRYGFAIEAYKMGKKLDITTKLEIQEWTNFVMKNI